MEKDCNVDKMSKATIYNPPFTIEEMVKAIKKLKNRKALSYNNIPNKLLEYGGTELNKHDEPIQYNNVNISNIK